MINTIFLEFNRLDPDDFSDSRVQILFLNSIICTTINLSKYIYEFCSFINKAYRLTSQIKRKSCCSTRNNSQFVFVTTVLSRGKSCNMDSPNVAPTPKLHNVTGS